MWSSAWNSYPLRLQLTCVYRKWSGKTWKQAFCSDLFMVNGVGLCLERLHLEGTYGNLKISGNVFRAACAFCFVLHIAVWGFFWKYHRKSCFGELPCGYQNIQLSKAEWAWLVPLALLAGAQVWSAWWVLRKQGWGCLCCLKRPLHEKGLLACLIEDQQNKFWKYMRGVCRGRKTLEGKRCVSVLNSS